MFRVLNAEIKKVLAKPGVYVLAVLLALILVLGVLIYKPTNYKKSEAVVLDGKTFYEKYDAFLGDELFTGVKVEATNYITDATDQVLTYTQSLLKTDTSLEGKSAKEQITLLLDAFKEKYNSFRQYQYVDDRVKNETSFIEEYKNPLIASLDNLKTAINTGKDLYAKNSYVILTTEKNNDALADAFSLAKELFDSAKWNGNSVSDICSQFDGNASNNLYNCINNLVFPSLADDFVKTYTVNELGNKLNVATNRMDTILSNILELHEAVDLDNDLNTDTVTINKLTDYANLYVHTAKTYYNLVHYELLNNAFNATTTKQQIDLYGIKNESQFNTKTYLIQYTYLFDNFKSTEDFANPLTIGVSSNPEVNAFDYAYFVLMLFSFILVVYAIMRACHTVAGEIREGSMRYLSIRPVNRTSVLWGKYLAIIVMSAILLVFSTIISLIVGGFAYGFNFTNILTVFNGTHAIVISPIVMILLCDLSILLQIMVYSSIALLLSCLIKSDLFAVTLILVLYLLNVLFPVFAGGANSWLAFYPFSHLSLFALFGSSIYLPTNNLVALLLSPQVYATTTLPLTIGIILLLILVPLILSSLIFKRKEL